MKKLTVGSCFSGIGGIELGLEWTGGFETKWQIEMDEYATKVLEKHWPNVKRYSDIRDVVRPEPVDLICGGFPCQDVSLAGKRSGLEGKRSTLWSEMFRLIYEVKPRWVLAENVPGLLSSDGGRFFGNILSDLASLRFNVEWGVLSAAGVGAPHLRRRVFILAHPRLFGQEEHEIQTTGVEQLGEKVAHTKSEQSGRDKLPAVSPHTGTGRQISDPPSLRRPAGAAERKEDGGETRGAELNQRGDGGGAGAWWTTEPDVGRVAHGVPKRVDRLKCLGNAVVPHVAQKIGEMILTHIRTNTLMVHKDSKI